MDCGPKEHDVCKDPELKADPDIAGIGVSYPFFWGAGGGGNPLDFNFVGLFSCTHTLCETKILRGG